MNPRSIILILATLLYSSVSWPEVVRQSTDSIEVYPVIEMHPFYEQDTLTTIEKLRKKYKMKSLGADNTALFWEGEPIRIRLEMLFRGGELRHIGKGEWFQGVGIVIEDITSTRILGEIDFSSDNVVTKPGNEAKYAEAPLVITGSKSIWTEKHRKLEKGNIQLKIGHLYRLGVVLTQSFRNHLRSGNRNTKLKYFPDSKYIYIRSPSNKQEESEKLFRLGYREYYINKDEKTAESMFNKALNENRIHLPSKKLLIHIYKKQGRYQEAITILSSIAKNADETTKKEINDEIRILTNKIKSQ